MIMVLTLGSIKARVEGDTCKNENKKLQKESKGLLKENSRTKAYRSPLGHKSAKEREGRARGPASSADQKTEKLMPGV